MIKNKKSKSWLSRFFLMMMLITTMSIMNCDDKKDDCETCSDSSDCKNNCYTFTDGVNRCASSSGQTCP